MAGLPKKYAAMGFKAGWAAYRRRKTTNRKVSTMAKRKHHKSSKSSVTMGNAIKVLTGAALAALYEVFVSPMIPLSAMVKNILELIAGLFLATMRGVPMPIRAMGAALATVNAYSLIIAYIPNGNGSGTAANTGW